MYRLTSQDVAAIEHALDAGDSVMVKTSREGKPAIYAHQVKRIVPPQAGGGKAERGQATER